MDARRGDRMTGIDGELAWPPDHRRHGWLSSLVAAIVLTGLSLVAIVGLAVFLDLIVVHRLGGGVFWISLAALVHVALVGGNRHGPRRAR